MPVARGRCCGAFGAMEHSQSSTNRPDPNAPNRDFHETPETPAMSSHRVACLPIAWSLLLGAVLSVHAEDVIVQVGVSDSVHSTRLNENRALIVYLPPGHESSGHSYP